MKKNLTNYRNLSRREFIRTIGAGAAAAASTSLLGGFAMKTLAGTKSGSSIFEELNLRHLSYSFSLNQNWLFGGKFNAGALKPRYDDKDFSKVTLPHCVSKLSWQSWKTSDWQDVWIYRRHFTLPESCKGMRVFLNFDGVMVGRTPVINGHSLPEYLGGYLPNRYEVTNWIKDKENVLAVKVDSRWSNVPPEGSPKGARRIDYLEPGGIFRDVHLQVLPQIFISNVFAKPVKVLDADRRVEVKCTIDAAYIPSKPVEIQVELSDKAKIISRTKKTLHLEKTGQTEAALTLSDLGNIKLWDVDSPHLYDVEVKLFIEEKPVHDNRVRFGFREAHFGLDGFFLNGKRLQLFGLNRHELFPYVGFAMPERVMRRDAEILRHEFNCNMVRCSHYPQNEAFLNACDELGLMVWEEVPGWGYIGDEPWQELLVRDVREMIIRDRNHPSIIIWGTRVNESPNEVELYKRTRALAKLLDDSRPSSGSMTSDSRKDWKEKWHEDVFAYDDYHSNPDGTVGIYEPVEGVPYMLAEAVGQFNYSNPKEGFTAKYRRAGDVTMQMLQAPRHAQAHNKAAANPRICGVIAWCGFEYASLMNSYNNVKYPGVADVFRIPKLGASFYQSQVSSNIRVVIQPNFYWDFGAKKPNGPGKGVSIFSNCERLKLFIDGKLLREIYPDKNNYPHIKYPPFFADLEINGKNHPELRVDGFIDDKMVLSKSFSSDTSKDKFFLKADDKEIIGDGSDATRLEFKVVDKYGSQRLFAGGKVTFEIKGPGEIVGDNPFQLEDSGGAAAVWIKAKSNSSGEIAVKATHISLGSKSVVIKVKPEISSEKI
ncbi:MAG: glycoside hydrolase family 2 protein [Ignavibacteriaceae bacterium]